MTTIDKNKQVAQAVRPRTGVAQASLAVRLGATYVASAAVLGVARATDSIYAPVGQGSASSFWSSWSGGSNPQPTPPPYSQPSTSGPSVYGSATPQYAPPTGGYPPVVLGTPSPRLVGGGVLDLNTVGNYGGAAAGAAVAVAPAASGGLAASTVVAIAAAGAVGLGLVAGCGTIGYLLMRRRGAQAQAATGCVAPTNPEARPQPQIQLV